MSDDLWTPPAVEPERPPASSPAERRAKRRAERATNAPRKRRPARVIVMVLAAVLVLGGGGVFLLRDQIFGSPLSPEQQAAALLQEAERRDSMRQDMIVEAHTLMQTTGSMVDDVSTLDALAEAITQAESVHFQRVPDGGDSGDETSGTGTSSTETSSTATSSAGNPASSPEALVLHAQGQLDAQTQALDQLRAAVDAVKESNNAYLLVGAVEEARAQAEVLQPILNQAEDLLMSSENAVTNETVRKDLADHITQAHRVMEKIHGNHADAYTERAVLRAKSAEDLVTAMDAVTQSHEAFVAAHAQAEAATDAAQHPTAGSWPRYETDYLM
ncbi:MAG: hypothetical protein LBH13_09585, partial [Cellulomonadaceae bacterium]|nr:hypothetical protein [Cellulomonadaceae bacterium]